MSDSKLKKNKSASRSARQKADAKNKSRAGEASAPGLSVAGIVRNSFVDWPGKIAFVVFIGGCNLSCPHCHNHDILCSSSNKLPYMWVLNEIKERIGFIDGVVVSGGEPTEHPHLREIIAGIRALGLPVKLDTNGTNFEILRELVQGGLVDFVAMDLKAPLEKYIPLGFTKKPRDVENVRGSLAFLKSLFIRRAEAAEPSPQSACAVPQSQKSCLEPPSVSPYCASAEAPQDVSPRSTARTGTIEERTPYAQSPEVMFRTTPIPELTPEDLLIIKNLAAPAPWSQNHYIAID